MLQTQDQKNWKSVQYESRSYEVYHGSASWQIARRLVSFRRIAKLTYMPSVGAAFLRRPSGATVSAGICVMSAYVRSAGYWSTATPIHSDLSGVMQLITSNSEIAYSAVYNHAICDPTKPCSLILIHYTTPCSKVTEPETCFRSDTEINNF
jgi:hypothetical protein